MKFTTAAALVLPVAAWASPIIEARQSAERAKFITDSLTLEGHCIGGSVSFDATNEIATVRLPNFVVQVPPRGGDRERFCNVALKVRYPLECTRGVVRTELSGRRALNGGVRGTYIRSYVMTPNNWNLPPTTFSPNLNFSADGSPETWRSTSDFISYTQDPNTPENQNVTIRMDGRLQLQESGGSSGLLSNDEYIINISDQASCECECFQK